MDQLKEERVTCGLPEEENRGWGGEGKSSLLTLGINGKDAITKYKGKKLGKEKENE